MLDFHAKERLINIAERPEKYFCDYVSMAGIFEYRGVPAINMQSQLTAKVRGFLQRYSDKKNIKKRYSVRMVDMKFRIAVTPKR